MQARFHRTDRLAQRLGHLLVRAFLDIAEQGAGPPVVRVTIDAKSPVLVGQQVTVRVQVLVPNFFMSGLEFSAINIRGTIVARPGADAEHFSETIRGERYAGIAQSFVVTPQQAGEFTLPPARITFTYAATPGQATDGAVTLPPRSFAVKLPAGGLAPGATPGTPVAKVTVTQSLDRGVDGVKVGDALTRTVSAFAERTPATMIPPPAFDAPAGVRVYRMDPVLSDETKDRVGLIGGHRTDRVTYLFEKPGDYTGRRSGSAGSIRRPACRRPRVRRRSPCTWRRIPPSYQPWRPSCRPPVMRRDHGESTWTGGDGDRS